MNIGHMLASPTCVVLWTSKIIKCEFVREYSMEIENLFVRIDSIMKLGYGWQPCTAEGPFPHSAAIRAGRDSDGCTIFVGRAFHEGDLLPAKVIPDKQLAYVCYGGEEHPKAEFEVLRSGDFVWEFATNGEIPLGAVEIGRTADGESLYCGRALYEGTQTPGKVSSIILHGSATRKMLF